MANVYSNLGVPDPYALKKSRPALPTIGPGSMGTAPNPFSGMNLRVNPATGMPALTSVPAPISFAPINPLSSTATSGFSGSQYDAQRASIMAARPAISPTLPQIKPVSAPISTPAPTPAPAVPRTPSGMTLEEAMAAQGSPNSAPGATPAPGTPPAPATPEITPRASAAVTAAEEAYQKSLQISPEELSTQGDLDKIMESMRKGYESVRGEPIAMAAIRGQEALITQHAANLAEPLEQKLARMQAARTSSLEASKFALARADTQAAALRPTTSEVAPGASVVRYNPATGKMESIFTAPPKALTPSEQYGTGSVGEYNYAIANGYKGSFTQYQNEDANRKRAINNINVSSTGTPSPAAKAWIDAIQANKAKLSDVPDVPAALKTEVAGGLGSNVQATELQRNAYTSAQDLLAKFEAGNKWAVGTTSMFGTIPGTQSRDFKVRFNNLKSLLSLEDVKYLKGQGQVSDAERRLLSEAAANLDLGQTETEFETNLKSIVQVLSKIGQPTATAGSEAPQQFQLPNGQVVTRQADGTYQ